VECSACRDAQTLDGIVPPCETDEGCWIPVPHPWAIRALGIHGLLRSLKDLNVGGTVLSICNASRFDLELIAEAEDELHADQGGNPAPEEEG